MIVVLASPLGAIFAAIMQSAVGGLIGLLAAVGCGALYYALNKRMTVGLVEMSGVVNQIIFKRSVLEGIKLDEQSSAQASDIIQWLMDSARTGGSGSSTSTTQQGHI